jgi:hypothetical protein
MSEVIQAGHALDVTDNQGQVFTVEAREADETMAFLKAFDDWYMMTQRAKAQPVADLIIEGLWSSVTSTYDDLLPAVKRQLPSASALGIRIAGHSH